MNQLLQNLHWLDLYVARFGVKLIDISSNLKFSRKTKFPRDISNIPTSSTTGPDSVPSKITGEDFNNTESDESSSSDDTSSDESLVSTPPTTPKKYKRILRPLNENDSPELPGK